MSQFEWSEPGKRLLLEFSEMILSYGGIEKLALSIENESPSQNKVEYNSVLGNKYTCRKRDCVYCRFMNPVEHAVSPEFIMSKMDYTRHEAWVHTELDLLLKNMETPSMNLLHQFPNRTYYALQARKTILRKQYGIQSPVRN